MDTRITRERHPQDRDRQQWRTQVRAVESEFGRCLLGRVLLGLDDVPGVVVEDGDEGAEGCPAEEGEELVGA